jgi:FixJ family two-component response regulator
MPLISIVDDDESVRDAVRGLLKALGFDAETFASARDFLRSGYAGVTACVVTDVNMPAMSGLELQTLVAGDNIPFIFITAFPNDEIRARVERRRSTLPEQAFHRCGTDRRHPLGPGAPTSIVRPLTSEGGS